MQWSTEKGQSDKQWSTKHHLLHKGLTNTLLDNYLCNLYVATYLERHMG